MKKLLAFLFILFTLSANAQKDFEGMIKYMSVDRMTGWNDDDKKNNDTDFIRMYFTPGKILIRHDDPKTKEDLLIIFDSAKTYTLNREERTYTAKRLRKTPGPTPATKERIAGYTATPESAGIPMSFLMSGILAWYADSLFYHIPPGFETNEELLMVRNNRILLKAEMVKPDDEMYRNDEDEEEMNDNITVRNYSFSLTAIEIKHGGINPADFVIPADYVKEKLKYYDVVTDTVAKVIVEPPPPPPPPRKNEKEKPTTQKSPVKKQD